MTMNTTAEGRWRALDGEAGQYLQRAIDCSSLTIPSLIPESSRNDSAPHEDVLESLYQGVGGQGVKGLASKLLLTLLPPGEPFFRFTIDEGILNRVMEERGGDPVQFKQGVDNKLSNLERQVLQRLDKMRARPVLYEALKHLIVGGNALLYVGATGIQAYSLRSYRIWRDPEGNPMEIVIRQQVAPSILPGGQDSSDETKSEDLYTHIVYNYKRDRVTWYQENQGKRVPRTAGFSSIAASPWIPLRLIRIAGESYGRGLVEEVLGDLSSLNELTRALVEGNLQAARTVWLVNPNGMTRMDALAQAENGDCVSGLPDDVAPLRTEKNADFSAALQMANVIERRLQFAFLMNETVQRNAERVTAEEIRVMAQSLDEGMGGYYSMLSDELQLPLIRRVSFLMQEEGLMEQLPGGLIEPQITTGVDAIGRANEKTRLQTFLVTVAQAMGPELLAMFINPEELIRRFAASDGIETAGLVKTREDIQREQAEQQRAQVASQVAMNATANGIQSIAPSAPQRTA